MVKVLVSFDDTLLQRIDRIAKPYGSKCAKRTRRQLDAYDASYVALAETEAARLITDDRANPCRLTRRGGRAFAIRRLTLDREVDVLNRERFAVDRAIGEGTLPGGSICWSRRRACKPGATREVVERVCVGQDRFAVVKHQPHAREPLHRRARSARRSASGVCDDCDPG